MSGAKLAPWWILVLEAAETWGVPPWEIGGGSKVAWWWRWKANRDAVIEVREAIKKNG